MASVLLQVKSNKPGSSTITLLDGTVDTGYKLKNTDLGNSEYDRTYSGMRGTQGARLAGATALNRLSAWKLEVVGTTQDDLNAKLSVLWTLDEELRRYGGTVTWRPQGGSYRMYLEALDSGVRVDAADYDWSWLNKNRLHVSFGIVTPPYMKGDPYDISDDFSVDTVGAATPDYTFDTGLAAEVLVTGGQLTAVSNLAAEKRLIHTIRGYTYGDTQATAKHTPGTTLTNYVGGVVIKRIDASNFLKAYVFDSGAASTLFLQKVVAGVSTTLASVGITRIVAGTPFWVRIRIEGNVVYAEYFTAQPTPMGTPANSVNYTLAGAEVTSFGAAVEGKAGILWTPIHALATVDDFVVEPYTYRNVTLPDDIRLRGVIPGDALALANLVLSHLGGATAPPFALVGWAARAAVYNALVDGDFEVVSGAGLQWTVAAVTNINGAATSKTVVTSAAKYGTHSLQIVCPATANTGANYRIFRKFRRGITYTFEVWVHSAAAVTNVYCRIGNATANDVASSGNTALSTAWQKLTVTWTPTADRDDAHVAVNIAAATATTFEIDAAMVYEGTVAPTSANQSEGRGGFPPFGVIEAENDVSATPDVSATYRSGFGQAGTKANLIVDPSLVVSDDYTQNEVAIEVWARANLAAGAASVVLVAQPPSDTANSRYPEEFGSAGTPVVAPASGTAFRFIRCGTLRLPTDKGRWLIVPTITGASAIDYLVLVPATGRALSPTGKANTTGVYPRFLPAGLIAEATRRIRSDLSGTMLAFDPEQPHSGLGGSLIELTPGNVDVFVKLSSLVPDDPSASTSSEQLAHSATLHFPVVPRWRVGRSS